MRADVRSRKALTVALAASLIAGCASAPPQAPAGPDWPMVPSSHAAQRTPTATLLPAAPEAPSDSSLAGEMPDSASALVSMPVPPDYSPMAELSNVFDRIRLGYHLPDVADRSIDRQARQFAASPEFLDRTFERAERYLYYVARELEGRHMPLELAMLPVIESAYNPYAYSRARAAGIWQFIAPTATRHQVRVDWWQDGRRDIVDSTRAALDYLSELHTMFDGDWLKAIAAYNCGENAVRHAVERNERMRKPTDFFHLKLPRETRAYVPRLLAMARIVANPGAYGLEFAPIANSPYFAQVQVSSQIDLRVAAALIGVGESELHELNPAYNRWATDPDGPYQLLVPFDSAPDFARKVTALSREARMPVEHYTLQPGDTLTKLATDRALTVPMILQMNGSPTGEFHVGDDLTLPATTVAPLVAGLIIEGETLLRGHHRHTYVVRSGDTLASIARRSGVKLRDLARLNGLGLHAHLQAGNKLVVETVDRHARRRGKRATPVKDTSAGPRKVSTRVRSADTVFAIARRFQLGVANVQEWNTIAGAGFQNGQKLVLFIEPEPDYGG